MFVFLFAISSRTDATPFSKSITLSCILIFVSVEHPHSLNYFSFSTIRLSSCTTVTAHVARLSLVVENHWSKTDCVTAANALFRVSWLRIGIHCEWICSAELQRRNIFRLREKHPPVVIIRIRTVWERCTRETTCSFVKHLHFNRER